MRLGHLATVAAATLACALPALAQQPQARPTCPATDDTGLSGPLAGWNSRADLAAVVSTADAGKAALPLGKGVNARLKQNGDVAFPVPPDKPGGPGSYGGLYEIRVAQPGDYQVSLGSSAWIELASGAAKLEPTSHTPGPACTTLKKTVTFTLKPGRYVLEIAGNPEPAVPVMVHKVR